MTGLRYKRNRYYDPVAGQFTQEDPIGLAGGVNLYLFAGGDPVNFGDPFGLAPCDDPRGCPEIEYEIPELPGLTATVTQNAEGPDRDDEAALLALFVEALAIGEKTFALLSHQVTAESLEYWIQECDGGSAIACGMGHLAALGQEDTAPWTVTVLSLGYGVRVFGPFTTKGVPRVIQRPRRYFRFDPPHHGKGWGFDGDLIRWIRTRFK